LTLNAARGSRQFAVRLLNGLQTENANGLCVFTWSANYRRRD